MECVFPLGETGAVDASRWCTALAMLVPYGGLLASGLQAGETALINSPCCDPEPCHTVCERRA